MAARPSRMRLTRTLSLAYLHACAYGFVPARHYAFQTFLSSTRTSNTPAASSSSQQQQWLNCGLLISSWTDGVVENPEALAFLKKGLACSLLREQQRRAETLVESSVMTSPCCGPDTAALLEMESIDKILASIQQQQDDDSNSSIDEWLDEHAASMNLKVLYIPTAMYALRADSGNTPGKQRQRARADGKKRRTQVVKCIQQLFEEKITVLTVTLDLDDGSVKQPQGSDNDALFPKNGRMALRDWSPNLIYVEGGNTFWLHHCLTKGDWEKDLISAITGNSVYCGKSAGAILAGKTVETATWKGWDDPSVVQGKNTYEDWKGIEGLNLVGGISFFPHMSDEWKELTEKKKQELGEVYCLRDEDVCLVDEKVVSIVSSDTAVPSAQ